MIRDAIEKILEMAKPATIKVNGRDYWPDRKLIGPPTAPTIGLKSLDALADYIRIQPEGLPTGAFLIVEDELWVTLNQPIEKEFQIRAVVASVTMGNEVDTNTIRPGRWTPIEDFIIKLQAQFTETPDKARVLKLLGSVTAEATKTDKDDGVTQKVVVKEGIALVGEQEIINPVVLAPYRTFREIEQPGSPFILRLCGTSNKEVALFEADGGAWRTTARKLIAKWLEAETEDILILA